MRQQVKVMIEIDLHLTIAQLCIIDFYFSSFNFISFVLMEKMFKFVDVLIKNGANINAVNKVGYFSLHEAIKGGKKLNGHCNIVLIYCLCMRLIISFVLQKAKRV